MTIEEYITFSKKTIMFQKETEELYNRQMEINRICKEKENSFCKIDDEIMELRKEGMKKFKWPEGFKLEGDTGIDIIMNSAYKYINNYEDVKIIIDSINSVPELKKASELENEREKLFFDYAFTYLKLDYELNKSRREAFSKEYLEKMDEYAKEGIMLYFLTTPDFPILDPEISSKMFLDAMLFDNCNALYVLFNPLINRENAGEPLKRKAKDIDDSLNNLINGSYRSAARTIFALIEADIKRGSRIMNGFFKKEKEYKSLGKSSKKFEEMIKYLNMPNAKENWEKLNAWYKKIVTGENPVLDRNKIVHGDYDDDGIDITEYDVVKLLLLYLSFRTFIDSVEYYEMIVENSLSYIIAYLANKTRKKEVKEV